MMKQPVRIVAQQQYPRCRLRRFLARSLDIALCSLLFTFITQIMGLLNAAQGGISVAVERLCVLLVALLLANAFCLTVWGTTPGKAVFGLHLETSKGEKPRFLDALRREWQVLLFAAACLSLFAARFASGFHIDNAQTARSAAGMRKARCAIRCAITKSCAMLRLRQSMRQCLLLCSA